MVEAGGEAGSRALWLRLAEVGMSLRVVLGWGRPVEAETTRTG